MTSNGTCNVPIFDIRRDKTEMSLLSVIRQSLNPPPDQPKTLTTLLLYDEKGLKLFGDITWLDEYYPTNAEIDTLSRHAVEIVARIPECSRVIELGSGNLRKIDILFKEFERAQKPVDYYALDLSLPEIHRTFNELDLSNYKYVSFHGLHGTYDDGLAWLKDGKSDDNTTCVISLGSSLGNFPRSAAADFLASFQKVLRPSDYVIIGLDACQDADRVFRAYNDSEHVTEKFYRNGLDHANRLFGYEAFKQEDWRIMGLYDEKLDKHEASYVARKDIETTDFKVKQGEKIHIEDAFKYSVYQSNELWRDAGLTHLRAFQNGQGDYAIHILSPSKVEFRHRPTEYVAGPVPTTDGWRELWAAWDTVTRSMVPQDELLNKPILLRNNLIFYLGHIPTFADIHFTRATGEKPIEPAAYATIFERGIDPDVDDPEICHNHSEIPETWPPLDEILDYATRVRARITESIRSGRAQGDRKLSRGLWLAYEHEAMHLETFLYMLIQSNRVLPPPGVEKPDFAKLAKAAENQRVKNKWQTIPASTITIGLDDPETDEGPDRFFGWDNERPSRMADVGTFQTQTRPISTGDYAKFLEDTHRTSMPASWASAGAVPENNGSSQTPAGSRAKTNASDTVTSDFVANKFTRTVYGLVPLKFALDWPIMASYDELAAYAKWANGRIPTFEEARSLYNYVNLKKAEAEKVSSGLISAVNGHLCNEGVEETPPSRSLSTSLGESAKDGLNPSELFIDLSGTNVGFRNWHPMPVTGQSHIPRGQSDVGGLWEWTSTPLAPFEGFKAMDLYPGYTADFFDNKHNICLGGSWATVPRIAGRKTFVNWYQRNYPFVWATARLVRDVN